MEHELQQALINAEQAQKSLLTAQAVADPMQIKIAQNQLQRSKQRLEQLNKHSEKTSDQQLQHATNLVSEALNTLQNIQRTRINSAP